MSIRANYPLSIQSDDLKRLSADEAVELFRRLLWAEASALGIAKTLINVPSAITVKDGGIDAEVTNPGAPLGHGIIKPGNTRYQIKTGEFNLSGDARIREILYKPSGKDASGQPILNTRIKACLDQGGTLVVVLFGWDGPQNDDNQVISRFRGELSKIDSVYASARVEVWQINQLISFLEPYPSMRLGLLGNLGMPFLTHPEWADQKGMNEPYRRDPEQDKQKAALQEALRRDDMPIHVRLDGEPGVGKTRLVLEATAVDDLAPQVLYCQTPAGILQPGVLRQLQLQEKGTQAILVVDECDLPTAADLWDRVARFSPRIKLVSLYPDHSGSSGSSLLLTAHPLSETAIAEIIAGYGIPADDSRRFVSDCGGSPRVAHVIGQNLKLNPEDLLRASDTVPIWDRFIAGREDLKSPTSRERRQVLLWLSLFKRFGYGPPYGNEADCVAKKIQHQLGIPPGRFHEIIRELRDRKILQGAATLYITPRLLHIYLWTEWWKTYGVNQTFDLTQFRRVDPDNPDSDEFSSDMIASFIQMFRYARDSYAAARFAERLLGPQGPFNSEFLDSLEGSQFFLALAEALPEKALRCLQRVLEPMSVEQLRQSSTGRRSVVHALEMMVVWKDLFADSARILLRLAEAENESWSNNASGVFVALFSPGPGTVAPSEASPEQRFPVLKDALWSASRDVRSLAYRACGAALQTEQFIRTIGLEHQGLRPSPLLWKPASYGELFDAYRRVWAALAERLETLPSNEQAEVVSVLLEHARGIARNPNLALMVRDTLEQLSLRSGADPVPILQTVSQILHFDGQAMPEALRESWTQLRDKLGGSDFAGRMRRYVRTTLVEDRFDETGKRRGKPQEEIAALAAEAIAQPQLLQPELVWLVTGEAANGEALGYQLGKLDTVIAWLPAIEQAFRACPTPSLAFLGGYLRALKERDGERWETEMDRVSQDSALARWVPELTLRGELMTQRGAERILLLAKSGVFSPGLFGLFSFGRSVDALPEPVFLEWIDFLLECAEPGTIEAALNLFDTYYLRPAEDRKLPRDPTLSLLIHDTLFNKSTAYSDKSMAEFHWATIAERFVAQYPDASLGIAEKMLKHFAEPGAITHAPDSDVRRVLDRIITDQGDAVWDLVTRYFGPPVDARAYDIHQWLRGADQIAATGHYPIEAFSRSVLWSWIDQDPSNHALYLAQCIPADLPGTPGAPSLMKEMLARYGDRKEVRDQFSANYSSGMWWGPASQHYETIKQRLIQAKSDEKEPNVVRWIDEFTEWLDRLVEDFRAREEREF